MMRDAEDAFKVFVEAAAGKKHPAWFTCENATHVDLWFVDPKTGTQQKVTMICGPSPEKGKQT